jgi:hypothetical protein
VTIKRMMEAGDLGEMRMAATAAVGLFPRIEIDPEHLIALLDEIAESRKLGDELREGLAWVQGLVEQARCAYCVPATLANMAELERAKEHMRTCDKHPLHTARAEALEEAAKIALAHADDVTERIGGETGRAKAYSARFICDLIRLLPGGSNEDALKAKR